MKKDSLTFLMPKAKKEFILEIYNWILILKPFLLDCGIIPSPLLLENLLEYSITKKSQLLIVLCICDSLCDTYTEDETAPLLYILKYELIKSNCILCYSYIEMVTHYLNEVLSVVHNYFY